MLKFSEFNIVNSIKRNIVKLFFLTIAAFYYGDVAYKTYEEEISSLPLNTDESGRVASRVIEQEAVKIVDITDHLFIITTSSYTSITDSIEELYISIAHSIDKFIDENQRNPKS